MPIFGHLFANCAGWILAKKHSISREILDFGKNYLLMTTIYPLIMGRRAILATEHYLSAAAGAGMFARGGNAIDAAVAATFVEGVVNPHMHTIGGEAPMLIYSATARRVVAINGNMMAPARATIEHYRSLGIELIPGAGLLAAGVPAAPVNTVSLPSVTAPASSCVKGIW